MYIPSLLIRRPSSTILDEIIK